MSETKSIPEPTYVYWLERMVKELEAQIEALRRETIDKCAEISSEHECLSYHELCNCRGAITDAILAMKETGE